MNAAPTRQWTLGKLLAESNLVARAETCGFDPVITDLCVDSRAAGPGSCFVALPGTRVDGHDFVAQVLAQGASAVIVQAGHRTQPAPCTVTVPDTHFAIARLASTYHGVQAAQRAGSLRLAGVTGTNGKTTTCALLRAILEAAGIRVASFGTIVNDTGTKVQVADMTTMAPLDLCRALAEGLAAGVTHAVLEVSSHALAQQRCAGLSFDVGVFTNLSRDHLDYHGDMDAYARAKRRLFEALPPTATAIVCQDDPIADFIVAGTSARVVRFGLDAAAPDVTARRIAMADERLRFAIDLAGRELPVETHLVGRHNVRNILAAACAAESLGVPHEVIARGIASVTCVPGRLECVEARAPVRVLVDYAHTPDALANVLAIVRETVAAGPARGKVICVFGCGGDRDRGKRPLMARTVAAGADAVVITSDNPRSEDPEEIIAQTIAGLTSDEACTVEVEPDRARAIQRAIALADPGDVVLVAGKGHEKHQIIGSRRVPFDDVEVARAAVIQRFGTKPRQVA